MLTSTPDTLSQERARRRGFSTLELVAVMVIMGILSLLVATSWSNVTDRAHDANVEKGLRDSMRAAYALATLRGDGVFEPSDFEGAAANAGAEVLAYSEWTFTRAESLEYGAISYEISPDGTQAGFAMASVTGRCGQGLVTIGNSTAQPMIVEAGYTCSGRAAGERLGQWSGIPAPVGAMPMTTMGTPVAGSFTADRSGNFFLADPDSDEPQWVKTLVLADVGTLSVDSNNDAAAVQFTPDPAFSGTYYFKIRLVDGAGNTSNTAVIDGYVVDDTTDPTPDPTTDPDPSADPDPEGEGDETPTTTVPDGDPYAGGDPFPAEPVNGTTPDSTVCADLARPIPFDHPCSVVAGNALVAQDWVVVNRTTVYGDIHSTGSTTISNWTRVEAQDGAVGYGDYVGGPITITNGSNVHIAGDVWANGTFRNDSPQTRIGGSVILSDGSVMATKTLTVNGQVRVNTPGTVSGPVTSGGTTVGAGVAAPAPVGTLPTTDLSRVTWDHTFATWAAFDAWYPKNKNLLGQDGYRTLRVTDSAPGVAALSGGTVHGHFMLVASGPMEIKSYPSASNGSTLTMVSLAQGDLDNPAITVRANSPSTADTSLIATNGELRFVSANTQRGQFIADTVRISQRTDIIGRPAAYWAERILTHP